MWNRIDLKLRGKAAFQRNYWFCVLVSFVVMIGTFWSVKVRADRDTWDAIHLGMVTITGGSVTLLNVLIFSVLEVGGCRFYMENASNNAAPDLLGFGFRSGSYGTIVVAQLLRKIYVFLWSLLFVVPGIMKAYSYCMVPYILADRADLTAKEALEISKDMMAGHRWETFVLDLSFFGWMLLSCLTAGILGVFYVSPYYHATKAELYFAIRENRS